MPSLFLGLEQARLAPGNPWADETSLRDYMCGARAPKIGEYWERVCGPSKGSVLLVTAMRGAEVFADVWSLEGGRDPAKYTPVMVPLSFFRDQEYVYKGDSEYMFLHGLQSRLRSGLEGPSRETLDAMARVSQLNNLRFTPRRPLYISLNPKGG